MEVLAEGGRAVVEPAPAAVPNDARAFADWVDPHVRLLTALAHREVGAADADDLVQDALVRAWRRRDTFDAERGAVRAWLVGILVDQARRRRIRHRYAPPEPVPVLRAEAAEDRIDLERAVRALPRRQREVVTLFYLADLSVAEVARVLEIGVGSVKSYLSAARDALSVALEQR